jgi:adenylosuccinate lyase
LLEHKTLPITQVADVLGIVNEHADRIEKAVKGLERDGVVEVKESVRFLRS